VLRQERCGCVPLTPVQSVCLEDSCKCVFIVLLALAEPVVVLPAFAKPVAKYT